MRGVVRIFIISIVVMVFSCRDFSAVKDPYTIYLHLSSEPATLNPVTATDAYSSSVSGYIYESMVDRDEDTLEIRPDLARGWEILDNGMRYRFYLKKGVLWSDGVELTADDVIYSYNRIMDPKVASAQLKVYYRDIRSVEKIDKYTVEFRYARPYFLALEICGGITVIPRHIFDDGTDFNTHKNNRHPVGTGPYKFEKWETGKKIVLVQNGLYRDKKPDIKRIYFKFIAEENVALQMLKKGELDMMGIRAIQWVRQTNSEKFKKNFYKLKYYHPYYNYIGWNGRSILFSDKRVRRAMTHLVNRKEILQKLLFGLGKIVTGNFYINSKSYNKNIKPYPFDIEKGKSMLKDAGWVDSDNDGILDKGGVKFSFTLTLPSGRKLPERIATIMKEDLAGAGIEMEINRYEWAVFLQKIHQRDFDAVILGWSLGYSGDPYQLWHSSQVEQGSNFCGFVNAEADRIIERARREFNEEKRIAMYRRFHEIIHEEQPYTFLYCTPALQVVSRRFENVIVHTTGLKIEEWRVKEGQ